MFVPSLSGIPRHALEALVERLERDNRELTANLTAVQALSTAQLGELRCYRRSGARPPGWTCRACGGFNGSADGECAECRACGALGVWNERSK